MIVYDNKLFIGGNFTTLQDTIQSYWTAYYNGTEMKRQTAVIYGGGPRKFAIFDNDLYSVGDWEFLADSDIGVAKWNGSFGNWVQGGLWENGSHTNYWSMVADGNYLYIATSNGHILRRTPDMPFETFRNTSTGGNVSIFEMIMYQGKLCVMGNFTTLEGVPVRNIALWNGTTWEALGTGVASSVSSAVIYQNELYVAGSFVEAGGVPAKKIAKWNGTSWSDVGGSVTGTSANGIRDLVPCGNLLFAVGDFDGIGGQTANDIASWDGLQWTTYNLPHSESILGSGAEYNGRLYFGGWNFTRSHVYGYSGNFLSLNEFAATPVEIYPNPSNGIFTLSDNYKGTSYEVFNSLGQTILTDNQALIDLSGMENGVYLLRFLNSNSEIIRLTKNW
uniref:Secretion system C-terminal sorting domain-containing protein n=1 Tax=Fluviicola taffensis (strain DSM 16823 / NCIMB 13979 / RW262) TaxID=755732 RepID=F2IDE7_FLUTR|nr:hypothetical protein Fluta_0314 [Fluviicola taffensis DSM 16823]